MCDQRVKAGLQMKLLLVGAPLVLHRGCSFTYGCRPAFTCPLTDIIDRAIVSLTLLWFTPTFLHNHESVTFLFWSFWVLWSAINHYSDLQLITVSVLFAGTGFVNQTFVVFTVSIMVSLDHDMVWMLTGTSSVNKTETLNCSWVCGYWCTCGQQVEQVRTRVQLLLMMFVALLRQCEV